MARSSRAFLWCSTPQYLLGRVTGGVQQHMLGNIVLDKLSIDFLIFQISIEDLKGSSFTVETIMQDLLVKMLHIVV